LNALNLVTTAAGTVAFTNASDVLNLTAGALLRSGASPASIGLTAESGSLTTGGTGASVPLYLWNNASTLTINSRILNNPTAGGALQLRTARGTLTDSIRPETGDTDAHEAIPTARGTWFMALHSKRSGVDLTSIGFGPYENALDSTIVEIIQ
jgi:hypothetical protein